MSFTRLDAGVSSPTDEGQAGGVLDAVATVLSKVFIPSLQRLEKGWGQLDDSLQGAEVKSELISALGLFVEALDGKFML